MARPLGQRHRAHATALPWVATVLATLAVLAAVLSPAAASRGDGTACYNACSGHGECKQFTCYCDPGYHGEDCHVTFVDDPVPVLTPGHFNVTAKSHRGHVSKTVGHKSGSASVLVLGYSALSCARCGAFEPAYANVSRLLRDRKVCI